MVTNADYLRWVAFKALGFTELQTYTLAEMGWLLV